MKAKKAKKAKKQTAGKNAARLAVPKSPEDFTTKHFKTIYGGLKAAGLGKFKIASLTLEPVAGAKDVQSSCVPVQLPDGSWTIKC